MDSREQQFNREQFNHQVSNNRGSGCSKDADRVIWYLMRTRYVQKFGVHLGYPEHEIAEANSLVLSALYTKLTALREIVDPESYVKVVIRLKLNEAFIFQHGQTKLKTIILPLRRLGLTRVDKVVFALRLFFANHSFTGSSAANHG